MKQLTIDQRRALTSVIQYAEEDTNEWESETTHPEELSTIEARKRNIAIVRELLGGRTS